MHDYSFKEVAELVLKAQAIRAGSYVKGTYKYAKTYEQAAAEVGVGEDHPLHYFVTYCMMAGEPLDIFRGFLKATA